VPLLIALRAWRLLRPLPWMETPFNRLQRIWQKTAAWIEHLTIDDLKLSSDQSRKAACLSFLLQCCIWRWSAADFCQRSRNVHASWCNATRAQPTSHCRPLRTRASIFHATYIQNSLPRWHYYQLIAVSVHVCIILSRFTRDVSPIKERLELVCLRRCLDVN